MSRSRDGWLRYHLDDSEIDEPLLHERLAKTIGRYFDSPYRDAGRSSAEWANPPRTQEELDDLLAFLARYLRQGWEQLEEMPMEKLNRMMRAASRLIALENGKRTALDLQGTSEEHR